MDEVWGRPVLTQSAAIKVAADFARSVDATKFFDAGDVQAAGFQIVEDDVPLQTITETGASYMGFAVSSLLASAIADTPRYGIAFSGDGSFFMNPQVLVDGVEHRARGTILLLDNRRMAAISGLQEAQYGRAFRTSDSVVVDYLRLASAIPGVKALSGAGTPESLQRALAEAYRHEGLWLVHVPVYYGPDPLGGLGGLRGLERRELVARCGGALSQPGDLGPKGACPVGRRTSFLPSVSHCSAFPRLPPYPEEPDGLIGCLRSAIQACQAGKLPNQAGRHAACARKPPELMCYLVSERKGGART